MGNEAPKGYLICDGATYNIEQYKQLAEYIKNQYGRYNYWGGDGETTFALPDMTGLYTVGAKNDIGTKVEAGLPNINGNLEIGGEIVTTGAKIALYKAGGAISLKNYEGAYSYTNQGITTGKVTRNNGFSLDASKSNAIYGNSDTVTPPSMKVLYCIKY